MKTEKASSSQRKHLSFLPCSSYLSFFVSSLASLGILTCTWCTKHKTFHPYINKYIDFPSSSGLSQALTIFGYLISSRLKSEKTCRPKQKERVWTSQQWTPVVKNTQKKTEKMMKVSVNTQVKSNVKCIIWCLMLMSIATSQTEAGSCRGSALCCNGRDSSCVVQKTAINTINEDPYEKPCYCDHACLKLGDCCEDFKSYCGGMLNVVMWTRFLSQTLC